MKFLEDWDLSKIGDRKEIFRRGLFYFSFLIFTYSLVFMLVFLNRPHVSTNFINAAIAPLIIILPLLVLRLKLGIKLTLNLVLFFTLGSYYFNSFGPELGLAALVLFPMSLTFSFLFVAFGHWFGGYVFYRMDRRIVLVGIVVFLVISPLFFYNTYYNYEGEKEIAKAMKIMNEITCKSSYTIVGAEEIREICPEFPESLISDGSNRYALSAQEMIDYCYDLADKIGEDKHYFSLNDYPRRHPHFYYQCKDEMESYFYREGILVGRFEYNNDSFPVRPEVLDPEICDNLDPEDDYLDDNRGHVADNCYSRAAIGNGDLTLCENTIFPNQCYPFVEETRARYLEQGGFIFEG